MCTHSPTHSKSWNNKVKTCLPCDKFVYLSRMMSLDKNEVIPCQKCPWNALYENGILLKILLFSKPNLKICFQSNTTAQSFLCAQWHFNVVETIRLDFLKKSEGSSEYTEKNRHFQEN